MDEKKPSLIKDFLSEPEGFSLVFGGFLFHLLQRAHLAGNTGRSLCIRILVITLLAWLPLLVLSLISGQVFRDSVQLSFLVDIETHVRFLLALPLLVVAESVVHQRIRPLISLFLERDLIPESAKGQFSAAIESAIRLRNSTSIELILISAVYLFGILFLWRTQIALDVSSWYSVEINGRSKLSPAGWWLAFISLPLFQFLLLRWYFRLFIWSRFLWQVSKISLNLIPTSPDRACGLGFLAKVSYVFSPLVFAQGVLLAGVLGERIFFTGVSLTSFEIEIIGMVTLVLLSILGPLLVFTPQIMAAKLNGLDEYGTLSQKYVRAFDFKWLRRRETTDEPFIGSADIQSLADLSNSFEIIKSTRAFPFDIKNVIQLIIITVLPIAPLLLTMFSLEDLLLTIFKILFR
ncbi:hypothetical protein ICN42_05695 [Polynucleobacter sp. 71A-WALBACH]|uniref:hypothetical protein n=1 Tax=Polynucleobacter sp. 71A-WALBACH TaxID=2689097 RepID=UPI001C0DCA90|nr:hypothetical protein [Polynucleobacter sp. 71A-WALBACH]MBU3593588.1 hypothetical protein [Polynucleobacter sp. 71A-WALBACH]